MRKRLFVLILAFILLIGCFTLTSCSGERYTEQITSIEQLENAKIGVITGSIYDKRTLDIFPSAEILYYSTQADMLLAIERGDIAAAMLEKSLIQAVQLDSGGFTYIDGDFGNSEYGFAFAKTDEGNNYSQAMSVFLTKLETDGTLDRLKSKWFGSNESLKELEVSPSSLTGTNGTLRYGTDATLIGYNYYKNGELVGYDVDVAILFAKEYGYALSFENVAWGSLLPGITSGKYDIVGACVTITEEREKAVTFSTPYLRDPLLFCVADRTKQAVLPRYSSFSDLDGKILANKAGSAFAKLIEDSGKIKNPQSAEYPAYSDMIAALNSEKVDAITTDEPIGREMANKYKSVCLIDEPVIFDTYSIYLQKNSAYTALVSQTVQGFDNDGTLAGIKDIWFGTDESKKILPAIDYSGAKTIQIGFNADVAPMAYILNNAAAGFEVDLIMRVCKELNLKPEFSNYSSALAMVAALDAKKIDLAIGCMSYTEERAQVADAVPYYSGGIYLLVKNMAYVEDSGGFFASLANSFKNTFIVENRYVMFFEGLWITVQITFFSAIFGLLGGFGICCLRRAKSKWLNVPAAVFIRIIQGLPMVLFLMILYYVVFISLPFSGITVAIIGFSISMAAYSSEMMRTAIDGIDRGQLEAARSMGFNKFGVFKNITLPQALKGFLPVFKGEFIGMLKNTAVVGYIAITDLTRVSDLIRARTFDAFFPLIATALIYFGIAYAFLGLIYLVDRRLNPKLRRERILKRRAKEKVAETGAKG